MSVKLIVDGLSFVSDVTLSDAEYAAIVWKSKIAENLIYWDGNSYFQYKLSSVLYTSAKDGTAPTPGTLSGYLFTLLGLNSSVTSHVSEVEKDSIIAQLIGPGSKDTIVTFSTLEGETVRFWTGNVEYAKLVPEDLVTPEPV